MNLGLRHVSMAAPANSTPANSAPTDTNTALHHTKVVAHARSDLIAVTHERWSLTKEGVCSADKYAEQELEDILWRVVLGEV